VEQKIAPENGTIFCFIQSTFHRGDAACYDLVGGYGDDVGENNHTVEAKLHVERVQPVCDGG
jgi:hypothetical protein